MRDIKVFMGAKIVKVERKAKCYLRFTETKLSKTKSKIVKVGRKAKCYWSYSEVHPVFGRLKGSEIRVPLWRLWPLASPDVL